MLALDGGGIRGLIAAEVLVKIESELRRSLSRDDDFVLADYFDYVAGTSTGAILATGIALGLKAETLRDLYLEHGEAMFDRASLLRRWTRYKYEDENLAAIMKEKFGPRTTLGSGLSGDLEQGEKPLRTLLMVVLQNATTDSPWPLSNNPNAKFNAPGPASNLKLPLWQIVRASTAAPTYFPPEKMVIGDEEFLFVDGGVSMFNNPAFLLYRMATLGEYRLGWQSGVDQMLLVSVGTGTYSSNDPMLKVEDMHVLHAVRSVPAGLMYGALNEQDQLCRTFGKCLCGDELDLEVGDLVHPAGAGSVPNKLFTYVRYNARLTEAGLAEIGVGDVDPATVQPMDDVRSIPELQRVGAALAEAKVRIEHFEGFLT